MSIPAITEDWSLVDRGAFLLLTEHDPLVRERTLRAASASSRFRVRRNPAGELEVQFVPRFTANGLLVQFMALTALASVICLLALGAVKHWGGWDLTPLSLPAGVGAAARLTLRRWTRTRAIEDISAAEYRMLQIILLATFVLSLCLAAFL